MIEGGRGPGGGGVAGSTIGPIAALVGVFFCVTGVAVLWGGFEIRHDAGIDVALCTQHFTMFSGQLESYARMIEIVIKAIQTIMTG